MSPTDPAADAPRPAPPRRRFPPPGRLRTTVALLAAFAAGGALMHLADGTRRATVLALAPAPVAALKDGPAAVKGQVAEVFGDKFVLADDSGRALVETGPAGRSGALVVSGEAVTVQGRFDQGALHAALVSHADGRQDALDAGPPRPPGPPWLHAGP